MSLSFRDNPLHLCAPDCQMDAELCLARIRARRTSSRICPPGTVDLANMFSFPLFFFKLSFLHSHFISFDYYQIFGMLAICANVIRNENKGKVILNLSCEVQYLPYLQYLATGTPNACQCVCLSLPPCIVLLFSMSMCWFSSQQNGQSLWRTGRTNSPLSESH